MSNIKQVLEAALHKAAAVWPPTTKNMQVRQTRHVGHCWRSRDELISDIVMWTPLHGRVKAGQPARTYTQQFCADTGCSLKDLPGAMDDREGWWERFREIHLVWHDDYNEYMDRNTWYHITVKTNYSSIGIVALLHIIVYKLSRLERINCYHLTVQTNSCYNQI